MKIEKSIAKEIQTSIAWTAALTVLFILFNSQPEILPGTLTALPFYVVLYFIFFSVGKDKVAAQIRNWLNSDIKKIVIFPAILLVLHFAYVLVIKQNPFEGSVSMISYLVFFPALVFGLEMMSYKIINYKSNR